MPPRATTTTSHWKTTRTLTFPTNKNNSTIKGIINGDTEYKISLYADDLVLLFFLQDPNASL